jgi:hypothetical protein
MNVSEAADYLAERGLSRSARWVRRNVPGRATGHDRKRRFWTAPDLDAYLESIRERPKGRAAAPAGTRGRTPTASRRREKTADEIKADLAAALRGD